MRFQTELEMYQGSHGMWMVAHMPFDARTAFGRGGIIRVSGTVNGFPFHSSIFPHRSGRHFLQKPKAVAKVAAARKLAIRLYWMLRTKISYPEIVRIEDSPRVPLRFPHPGPGD
jgi:hypothetical protein